MNGTGLTDRHTFFGSRFQARDGVCAQIRLDSVV